MIHASDRQTVERGTRVRVTSGNDQYIGAHGVVTEGNREGRGGQYGPRVRFETSDLDNGLSEGVYIPWSWLEVEDQPEVAPIVVGPAPTRPYDFNAGDRRFFDAEEAIGHAQAEHERTGLAQSIRPSTAPHFTGGLIYLVQAVGA